MVIAARIDVKIDDRLFGANLFAGSDASVEIAAGDPEGAQPGGMSIDRGCRVPLGRPKRGIAQRFETKRFAGSDVEDDIGLAAKRRLERGGDLRLGVPALVELALCCKREIVRARLRYQRAGGKRNLQTER